MLLEPEYLELVDKDLPSMVKINDRIDITNLLHTFSLPFSNYGTGYMTTYEHIDYVYKVMIRPLP